MAEEAGSWGDVQMGRWAEWQMRGRWGRRGEEQEAEGVDGRMEGTRSEVKKSKAAKQVM